MTSLGAKTRAVATQKSFGDFQTPRALADRVAASLGALRPRSILEPTCGQGAFLEAARAVFRGAERFVGLDIDAAHLAVARARLAGTRGLELIEADVFTRDLEVILAGLPRPILLLGNPPWVTSADQGRRGATNLPAKHSRPGERGLDARTGRANFDVAEWILTRLVEALTSCRGTLSDPGPTTMAMLVKTSTARRTLAHLWRTGAPVARASLRRIDAAEAFGVSVDAGLLEVELGAIGETTCGIYANLDATEPTSRFGLVDGCLAANVDDYARHRALDTGRLEPWRSGVKHDCARVLELSADGEGFRNGLDERCELEAERVFPLLKSTDLARARSPRRWILVPQRVLGEDTALLATSAPKTHAYLTRNSGLLGQRKSSIYRGRPPFSIFGVGPYTFAPWKVAISGLHKHLSFRLIGPQDGRPVLLDDTCYFLPFDDEAGAREAHRRLESEPSHALLASLIFWDAKRPVTKEVLGRLDLQALGRLLAGP